MLRPGSHIRVVAPSGAVEVERIEAAAEVLRGWGYRVSLDPQVGARHRYLAGTDEERLAALRSADADAIWMARGGFGLGRLLPALLDAPLPPIPFLGFSDGSALLNHHPRSVHAPVLNSMTGWASAGSMEHLRAVLAGERPDLVGESWVAGAAEGRLAGGNLCVLASLAGTLGAFRGAGCIVALEEVGEAPYKVDRLLTQLIHSGAFAGVRGFALGTFTDCAVPPDAGWTLRDVIVERLGPLGVPIVGDLPFGHGRENRAFAFGPARIGDGRVEWAGW